MLLALLLLLLIPLLRLRLLLLLVAGLPLYFLEVFGAASGELCITPLQLGVRSEKSSRRATIFTSLPHTTTFSIS
jgi:hypothetical protein